MKSLTSIAILLLFLLPTVLWAQWERGTGFSLGIISPDYPKGRFPSGDPGVIMKLGINQSWHQPDKKVSLRPEISLNTEIFSIDYSHGGKAAGGTHEGTIVAINCELAAMIQIRILPRTMLVFGPSGKFLLTDITDTEYTFDGGLLYPDIGISKEFNGFNREYLNKPSIGIKAMLIQQNLNEKINMGLVFDYQWKNAEEEYFYFSRTMEVSFYLELR